MRLTCIPADAYDVDRVMTGMPHVQLRIIRLKQVVRDRNRSQVVQEAMPHILAIHTLMHHFVCCGFDLPFTVGPSICRTLGAHIV